MTGKNIIEVSELTKAYKIYNQPMDRLKEALHPWRRQYHQPFFALTNVSFRVSQGEVVGIVGKNGSGKSTLLKLLTGVLTPSSGLLQVQGKVSALLELGAGFNPELTGLENIYMQGTLQGYSKEVMRQKAPLILEFADIGEYIHQPVKSYSSGMFARLAFALVVHVDPDILIVDEALAVGDIRFQQKAIRKMQELMAQAKVILFVSHDMRSIRTLCTRVLWLSEGRIFRDGDPKAIARMYEDYMLHDILPKEHLSCLTTTEKSVQEQGAPLLSQELDWQNLQPTSQLGGEIACFRKIAVQTSNGANLQALEGNETLTVWTTLQARQDIAEPLAGLGLFNDKGIPVVHFNSGAATSTMTSLAAGTEVCLRFHLQLPNLRDGTYFLSLGLDDGVLGLNTVIHHASDCCCLKVQRQDRFAGQYGLVILPDAMIDMTGTNESGSQTR